MARVHTEQRDAVGLVTLGPPARRHALSGRRVGAVVAALATRREAQAPLSIAVMKEPLRLLAGAHRRSPQGFDRIQGLRRRVCDRHDGRERIRAFRDERPALAWCMSTAHDGRGR